MPVLGNEVRAGRASRDRPFIPTAPLIAAAGIAGVAWVVVSALLVATVLTLLGASAPSPSFDTYRPSGAAVADIPAEYLAIYRRAGSNLGLDWAILAAIGKVETDHGRSRLPGVHAGVNCAGAAGPMQLGIGAGNHGCGDAGNAWATYGTDGNHDGRRDVYDPADAIPAAAAYLRVAGAPSDYRAALFAYNHAGWYVAEVLATAERYRGASRSREHKRAPRPFHGPVASTCARHQRALRRTHRQGRALPGAPLRPDGHGLFRSKRSRRPWGASARARHRRRSVRPGLGPNAGGSAAVRLEPDLRGEWMRRRDPPSHARRPLQRLPRSR